MMNLPKAPVIILLLVCFQSCQTITVQNRNAKHDMVFDQLASSWDEAVPLGNGMLGALVWQNGGNLRLSLDRADLWDLRPMHNLKGPQFKYQWVYDNWKNNTYHKVQEHFDDPYNSSPAPSKIPAGALEFNTQKWGKADSVRLHIQNALCEVSWSNGSKLFSFVHASEPIGWFRFENIEEDIIPVLLPPAYSQKGESSADNSHSGPDLRRLGYKQGIISSGKNQITYDQEGWGGFKYKIHVSWEKTGKIMEGCWSISSEYPGWQESPSAIEVLDHHFSKGFRKSYREHLEWWQEFWAKSSIQIPDSVLEKQWYLEQYKFGSAARSGTPPISLQAVWTADNGKLPPWKGDFHHDLNTQLSYWPAYSSNHLDLEEGFIDWLWKNMDTFKYYTKTYYETNGLNVPGVTTLTGDPMGGWIQYSFGPTVSAWLGHHFYLHWRYTMDREFLKEKAYPWLKEVAIYFDELSTKREDGKRQLPISSSPEINDNSREAWFSETTNFDLALIRWTYAKAAELAAELGENEEEKQWSQILNEWPDYAIDEETGLMFAPKLSYHQSHRHFSHLMAIHPLGLIDWSQGEDAQQLITKTINNLQKQGSDWWVGYSFSWLGNLQARMFDGEGAAKTLRIFAENFCLPNTFHVNGEQHDRGYSKFKYRPFTLEGNFAFASGIQEMLIQSHAGIVKIFPAVPESWKEVSFQQLRTEGAFLISAQRKDGVLQQLIIKAEKDGIINIENSFPDLKFSTSFSYEKSNEVISIQMKAGETVEIKAKS